MLNKPEMDRIFFYLFYLLSRLLSLLPFRVLYMVSDVTKYFVYYVFRYRRATVLVNLKNAFPTKSEQELKNIEWKFYQHFCDLFLEVNFALFASPRRAKKLVTFKNPDLINRYFDEGKSAIVAAGHYCNWEILSMVSLYTKHSVIAAYKPLKNKHFESFINKSRERFGCIPVPMNDIARMAIKMACEGKPFFLGLFADQTPKRNDIRYWTNFLNQDTPVFLGTEKIARRTNQPVFFCNMYKVSRGHYEVEFELLVESPKDTKPYDITESHVRALEHLIQETPQYWLWSHRRWKHQRKRINQPLHDAV